MVVTLKISVAVASPRFTGVFIAVASTSFASGTVNTGLVVSIIVICCWQDTLFPFSSIIYQVIIVVPNGKSRYIHFLTSLLTELMLTTGSLPAIDSIPNPDSESGASHVIVTPKISLASASKRTLVFTPVASMMMSTGTLTTGFVVSTIVTFCTPVVAFPFSSVAVQITSVVPIGKSAGALFVIVTLKISVAVACPIATGVLTAVASVSISAGKLSTGFVVSLTVTD